MSETAYRLRRFTPADGEVSLELFRDTVLRINSADYTPDQVAAWRGRTPDLAAWTVRFDGQAGVVAETPDGTLAGFADMTVEGWIDRLFVHADHQRQGVATRMLAWLENQARDQGLRGLGTDASITARPFFENNGFTVEEAQDVRVSGQTLRNFRMSKRL